MSRKMIFRWVACKKDRTHRLQPWVPSHAVLYSRCAHCGADTSARPSTPFRGANHADPDEHYVKYEVVVTRLPKESIEACFDRVAGWGDTPTTNHGPSIEHFSDDALLVKTRGVTAKQSTGRGARLTARQV